MPIQRVNEVKDLKILAEFMDSKFQLPLGIRVGFDGILGFIPVVGGLLTTGVSGYIVARAAMLEVSLPVLLRMLVNIMIDNIISIIPIFGWFGDFVWKSNNKNLALIEAHANHPARTTRSSTVILVAIILILVITTLTLAFLAAAAAWWAMNFVIEQLGLSV